MWEHRTRSASFDRQRLQSDSVVHQWCGSVRFDFATGSDERRLPDGDALLTCSSTGTLPQICGRGNGGSWGSGEGGGTRRSNSGSTPGSRCIRARLKCGTGVEEGRTSVSQSWHTERCVGEETEDFPARSKGSQFLALPCPVFKARGSCCCSVQRASCGLGNSFQVATHHDAGIRHCLENLLHIPVTDAV